MLLNLIDNLSEEVKFLYQKKALVEGVQAVVSVSKYTAISISFRAMETGFVCPCKDPFCNSIIRTGRHGKVNEEGTTVCPHCGAGKDKDSWGKNEFIQHLLSSACQKHQTFKTERVKPNKFFDDNGRKFICLDRHKKNLVVEESRSVVPHAKLSVTIRTSTSIVKLALEKKTLRYL